MACTSTAIARIPVFPQGIPHTTSKLQFKGSSGKQLQIDFNFDVFLGLPRLRTLELGYLAFPVPTDFLNSNEEMR